MKVKKRYRITIEDESRLRRIASVSMSPLLMWIAGISAAVLTIVLAAFIIMVTPIRTLMPGYLKAGARSQAEKGLLRIDSINEAYRLNSQYINNILTVLDTDRTPSDSILNTTDFNELPPDSLLPASKKEIEFISSLKDREQYNINILAPLAADQLRIFPVAPGGVISDEQTNSTKVKVVTPKGSPACAMTDGRVLAIQNPAPEGGSAIILQHDGGFASRYSHLGTPAVKPGMHVDGGSVIALGASGGSLSPGVFFLEMWYDGTPVEPARYLQSPSGVPKEEPFTLSGRPMGR